MMLIGSLALAYHIPLEREVGDIDLVGGYDEIVEYRKTFGAKSFFPINSGKTLFMKNEAGAICEADVAWPGSVAEKLLKFVMNESDTLRLLSEVHGEVYVPSLDVLYLLKMSHRYLKDSPHFLKTMRDIHAMWKAGAKIRPEHQVFYEERMKDTYVYKHPKLDVSKGEFFDSSMTGVWQKFDHDSIHVAVKHLGKPAYTYFKPDEAEVMCSRELFEAQPETIKLYSVLEEVYTLALERSLIPFPSKKTPKEAFNMAHMKVCTSIASGFWREYAWENYDNVQALYNDNYVDKFQEGVDNGTVILNKELS